MIIMTSYIDVFYDNLSSIYIATALGGILLVVFTFMLPKKKLQNDNEAEKRSTKPVEERSEDLKYIFKGEDQEFPTMENFHESIPGKVKRARQIAKEKKMKQCMSTEDIEEEIRVKKQQLQDILNVMQENQDKFGKASTEEIENQMQLYL